MLLRLRASLITLTILLLAHQALLAAPEVKPQAHQTIPGLGTASFATSTRSADAQTAFLRGLLLLHLFQYAESADAFVAAQKLDPGFAMAYWGEAMTFNHPVWNQLDTAGGSAALKRFAPTAAARAARIANPRERAYMAAVELLYDNTGTKPERDARYAAAMEQVAKDNPHDDDAQLFYALALLGKSEGVRDVPTYLRAASISQAVFTRQPDNPGAAHYWIHGMDDPDHAAGALVAARALAKIAPDAGHAQHMCSHIFMALGMWDDVVQSNLDAIRVDDLEDTAAGFPIYGCGHYPEWLEYAYFQQGRTREALQTLARCHDSDPAVTSWIAGHAGQLPFRAKSAARLHMRLIQGYVRMRDTAVVESQAWTSAAVTSPIDSQAVGPEDIASFSFATGLAAAERGDLGAAHAQLKSLADALEKMRASTGPDSEEVKVTAIELDELTGLIQAKEHDSDSATAILHRARDSYEKMAFVFGPPVTIKPPEELLGEVLFEKGDAIGARAAFEQSLKLAPQRTQSLVGLARAESRDGDNTAAKKTYSELLTIWHTADPDTPGLAEARAAIK